MSASQEKKKRISDRATEKEKLAAEQAAEAKKKSLKKVRNIIIAVVVVLVIAAIFVINSNLFYTGMTAVEINGTKYTAAEVNYTYRTLYSNYLNQISSAAQQYGMDATEYASMLGLDTSKSLDDQKYYFGDGTQTWGDYFRQQAIDSLRTMTMHVDKAKAEGFSLSEEELEEIDVDLSWYEYYASISGYSSVQQYLAAQFGKGVTMDTVRKMTQLSELSSHYAQKVQDSFTYSDETLDEWYAERKEDYDMITFRSFFVNGSGTTISSDPTEEDNETAMEHARITAETLVDIVSDEESFEMVASGQEGREANRDLIGSRTHAMGKNLSTFYKEWLLDESRRFGDIEILEATSGYYVVFFISRDDNSYTMKQVRHILVKAEADENGEYTDEAKAAALAQAEAYLDEWKAGEATEDSFAEMATEHSEDTGSNTKGGLYDQVVRNAYVPEFEAFAFDESRQPGDTGIVYGESDSYAGYHVMYFVGEGERYDHYIASSELRSGDATAWEEENVAGYEAATNFSFRFVK